MTAQTYDPHEHARRLGVQIVHHTLRSTKGLWVPSRRMVLIGRGLRPFMERAVLAHELDHAEHDDPPGHHPRNEARANLHAAQRLIDPREWYALTRIYPDYDKICIELGITREQFVAYAEHEDIAERPLCLTREGAA